MDLLAIGYFLSTVSVNINTTVKEFQVDLDNSSLGDAGTKSLMHSICRSMDPHSVVNTRLVMYLNDNEIHEDGASHIADVLSKTSILHNLILRHNPCLSDTGARFIANGLKRNTAIKSLSLSKCGITSKGAKDLSIAVAEHPSLKKLFIHNNPLGDEGIAHLSECLKQNWTLKHLYRYPFL